MKNMSPLKTNINSWVSYLMKPNMAGLKWGKQNYNGMGKYEIRRDSTLAVGIPAKQITNNV